MSLKLYIIKKWKDNRGKLYKFKSIWDIENKESNVGDSIIKVEVSV